jgi:membrane protein DedA with SNARE-associated domain
MADCHPLCYFECRMETYIAYWVTHYGYGGIFVLLLLGIVGLPVPDETLLTFAGYCVYKNHLLAIPTYAIAALGSMCGITISYILGRSIGLFVIHHYGRFLHITPAQMDRVHAWFDRFGTWTLVIGYFIPGVRHLTAVVAGTSNLRPLLFAVFAYSGALIWSATFITLGYLFGEQWDLVLKQVHHHLLNSVWIIMSFILILLIWTYWKKRRKP